MGLINDLLDLAKLESGKMEMNYTQSCLLEALENCLLEQEARQVELGIHFKIQSDCISGNAVFDCVHMAQVITNLLSNAIKYTPKGKNIDLNILHSELENSDGKNIPALLFSIRDYGSGILENEDELIFNHFIQGSDTTIGTTKGTGLGLPICKEIIDLHQGNIWAENHPDGGAIFKFIIPVDQRPAS